ncbi:MAG: glycosyltransferase [Acidimicrobiales bacterium]|nr:glycosyltransferase [Acidimicrobiales bacterium]
MRVLWLAGDFFDPPANGLFRYSKDVARAMQGAGARVDFIGRRRDDQAGAVDDWTLLESHTVPAARKLLGRWPVKVADVWGDDYGEAVRAAVAATSYDVVVIDHLRAAGALHLLPDDQPIIYLSHNDESVVKRDSADRLRYPKKALMRWDERKITKLENELLERALVITAIAEPDRQSFGARVADGTDRILTVEPPYRGPRVEARAIDVDTPRRVVILNNLGWSVKLHNTLEFIEQTKRLAEGGVEIIVAGGWSDSRRLRRRYPWVHFAGFVPDLNALLAETRIGLVYEPVGGGFKMKTLDYVFRRVPMVVLKGSIVGIPLQPGVHYVEAANAVTMVDACLRLVDDVDALNDMQNRTYEALDGRFTAEDIGPRLCAFVEERLARRSSA